MLALSFTVLLLASGALGQSIQQGQCNGAMQTQLNLVPSMLNGRWYQIERVNNEDETGQCSTTEYIVENTNTLRVVNREIVSGRENVRNGTAVRNSGDTSGRLIITYEGNTNNYPYWVLATDYVNFAFLYSCINLSGTTRAVYSWKLSRTTSLGTVEQMLISNLTAISPELSGATFTTVSHSADACRTSGASILTSSYIFVAAAVFSIFKKSC